MDYSRYIAKAETKIARYSAMAEFFSNEQLYDPISGQMSGKEMTEKAMCLLTRPDKKALTAGGIEYGDAILLAAGSSLANRPAPGCLVKMNNRTWRIIAIDEIAPDGTPILYKLQVRQA